MAKRRPKMETKEELIKYLKGHSSTELPFNEDVWNRAVELTENKVQKSKKIVTTDFDGTEKTMAVPNGSMSPVGTYFRIMALPQYKKQAEYEEDEDDSYGYDVDNSDDDDFEDDEKSDIVNNWIDAFFGNYGHQDKKFLKERLGDYYDTYDINDGADKLIVVKAVSDELEMMNLTRRRATNKDNEKRIETIQKNYLSLLESLRALKKQRGSMEDEGTNKFSGWVDTLTKDGGFKHEKKEYPKDEIDNMLDIFIRNIMEVARDA